MDRLASQNRTLPCQKCKKNIPYCYVKIHSKYCKGKCPINPIIAELFTSRINLFIEIIKQKAIKNQEIKCSHCEQVIEQKTPEDHVFQCQELPVNCSYCELPVKAREMVSHLEQCLPQFSQSYILMKDNKCCRKLRGNTSVINTQKEFMVEKLMQDLKIPSSPPKKTAENNLGEKIYFSEKNCDLNCDKSSDKNSHQIVECSFCKVDFLDKEQVKRVNCGHMFHIDCLMIWNLQADNCPSCKASFT